MGKFVHVYRFTIRLISPNDECYSTSRNMLDGPKAILVKSGRLQVLVTSLGWHFEPQLVVKVPSEVRWQICSVNNLAHDGPRILQAVPRGATKSIFLDPSPTHHLLCMLKLAHFYLYLAHWVHIRCKGGPTACPDLHGGPRGLWGS